MAVAVTGDTGDMVAVQQDTVDTVVEGLTGLRHTGLRHMELHHRPLRERRTACCVWISGALGTIDSASKAHPSHNPDPQA